MNIITMQLLTKCTSNAEMVKVIDEHKLKVHSAKRMAKRMKVYFEPTHDGDNIDCVSLPLELFNEDSYMPSWLKLF